MSESFADLFEESLSTIEMEPGAIVTGTVIDIDSDWVIVHAGLKSEGVIPRNQFYNEQGEFSLEIGDQVKVAMEVVDDGFHGHLNLVANLKAELTLLVIKLIARNDPFRL